MIPESYKVTICYGKDNHKILACDFYADPTCPRTCHFAKDLESDDKGLENKLFNIYGRNWLKLKR
jgi:hypothetical protein